MSKVKTLADLEGRKIFAGVDETFVNSLSQYMELNVNDVPVIMRGLSIDESGELIAEDCFSVNEETGFAPMVPMISKLTKRVDTGEVDEDGKKVFEQQIKAIVVSPVPTLDSLLAHAEGRSWLDNKLATELSHITMRNLRDAEDVEAESVLLSMPKDIDAFINAKRSGGKSDNEAFNALWKLVLDGLKRVTGIVSDLLNAANLRKSIFEKALKNKAYATAMYSNIENARIFEGALALMIKTAEKEGLDASIIRNWLETRNDAVYEVESFDLDSIDLGNLDLGGLGDDEDEEEEEVVEGEAIPEVATAE